MVLFKKNFWIHMSMEFLNLNICYIWAQQCHENIEHDLSQPPIIHPGFDRYDEYGDYVEYVDESEEYVIKSVQVICENVTFPWKYNTSKCTNCTRILRIESLYDYTIPSEAFEDIYNISNLFLKNLHITNISSGAFGQNPLTEINLSGNKLEAIYTGIFSYLVKLRNLDLSLNEIKTLFPDCFAEMTKFNMLNISKNQLTEFSFNNLGSNVTQINYFDISFNKLSKFDLDDNINVLHMWLNNNQIREAKFCPLMPFSLYLNNNYLKTLPEGKCIASENKLFIFDVGFNQILEIKPFYFKNSSNLEFLFLNHNNISEILIGTFNNLISLKALNLSHNDLQHFHYGTFDELRNLEVLDVSHNNIRSVNMIFYHLSKLRELYLQNNKLNTIDSIPNLNLQKLSIYNNNFTCENLLKIFQNPKIHSSLTIGPTRNISNIHGITCSDNQNKELLLNKDLEYLKLKIKNVVTMLLKENHNKFLKERNILKDYFDNDFKNSNFYKFMLDFEQLSLIKFNEAQFFKYFNENFKNSNFYKYSESLIDKNNLTNFKINMYEYFNVDFRNSGFVKYFEDLKKYKNNLNEGFLKGDMYNFFC